MKKMKIAFPNGMEVIGTLQEKEEPELSESLWNFAENGAKLICHNTLSTGYAYGAYSRPTRSPIEAGFMGRPVGNDPLSYTKIQAGQIVWTGNRMFVSYGPCTEPGIVGAVTLTIDPEYMEAFKKASDDIWLHTYSYHKLAIITVERQGE